MTSTPLCCIILDEISENIIGDDINFNMVIIAITLIVMGIILYIVDKKSKSEVSYEKISLKQFQKMLILK